MEWINAEIKVGRVLDPKTRIIKDIIRKIPDDVYHLEISNAIEIMKSHPAFKYIYFITENLDEYEDEEKVKIWDKFIVKNTADQIVFTDYNVTDYIRRD